MWDFLDSKSHRHLVIFHKEAVLQWNKNDNSLNVTYDHIHNLTSAGFRVPISLEPGQTYQISVEAQLIKGDKAFIYVETNQGKRLLPRYKINSGLVNRFKHDWFFVADDTFDPTFLGILFFYPDQDYELNVYSLKLKKVDPKTRTENLIEKNINNKTQVQAKIQPNATNIGQKLTTQNLAQHNLRTGQSDDLSILSTSRDLDLITAGLSEKLARQDFERLLINSDASHLTVTPSEYQQLIMMRDSSSTISSIKNTNQPVRGSAQGKMPSVKGPQRGYSAPNYTWKKPSVVNRFSEVSHSVLPKSLAVKIEQIPTPTEEIVTYLRHMASRIVVGLTTTPKRIGKMYSVVESLLNQSLQIDKIYLVVPERYKKDNKPYLIGKKWTNLLATKRFKIVRCPDYGPMTKLLGLFRHESDPQTLILTADDDHHYPEHWAYYLAFLPLMRPQFKGLFGLKGYWDQEVVKGSDQMVQNVDFLCGEWGVAGYFLKYFKKNTDGLIRQLGYGSEAFISDDVLIANHGAKLGLARILIGCPTEGCEMIKPQATKWANQIDALNRIKPSQGARYLTVMSILKEKNKYYLNDLGPRWQEDEEYFAKNPRLSVLPNKMENPSGIVDNQVKLTKRPRGPRIRKRKKLSIQSANINYFGGEITENELGEKKKGLAEIEKENGLIQEQKEKLVTRVFSQLKSRNIYYLPTPDMSLTDHEFNPQSLAGKKILYLSFMPPESPDLVLMYIKYLGNQVTLRFPKYPEIKMYLERYNSWLNRKYQQTYDLVILDVPYCFQKVEVKDFPEVQQFYIYRYPELGNISQLLKKFPVLVNSHYYGHLNAKRWGAVPKFNYDKEKIPNWRKGGKGSKQKHLVWILSHDYYLNNLEDFLINYWKKFNPANIKLHLGMAGPPAMKLQQKLNDLGLIQNVVLYTQSQVFPTLIYHADYYLNVGFYFDFYALWAEEVLHKPLIMLKYGEFEQVKLFREIPYDLSGQIVICNHVDCRRVASDRCRYYGYMGVENVPQINWDQFHGIINGLHFL
jgi:hypothetical protein